MKSIPSIFNDVIGPVMRGPSSSHTAASWRIARTCLDILGEPLKSALIEFDKEGIWAHNYREQGTVMGMNGGLLGLEMTDPQMKETESAAIERGISISYEVTSYPTKHVNTVRLKLQGINGITLVVIAASLGGGSFEIQQVDGFDVNIRGDYYELIVFSRTATSLEEYFNETFPKNMLFSQSSGNNGSLINLKFPNKISDDIVKIITEDDNFDNLILIDPVLPIISGNGSEAPFSTIDSLIQYTERNGLDLGEVGIIYEKSLSGLSDTALNKKIEEIVEIIENSIHTGLKGPEYQDRILGQQSHLIDKAEKAEIITQNSLVNNIIKYVTAIMESKSAMEVIAANPTAGSCGTVGGLIKAVAEDLNSTEEEKLKAYFAAGLVGAYFAMGPGFSAEEHGCQVECGAASGMGAAGVSQLFGGTAKQALDSASMAIQNMIGLVCDPIADRVEAPCLGKNISAAVNALCSATMASAGFDAVIPLNEVIDTVSRVSSKMPTCVKCTGKGGLAITPTALKIKEKIN